MDEKELDELLARLDDRVRTILVDGDGNDKFSPSHCNAVTELADDLAAAIRSLIVELQEGQESESIERELDDLRHDIERHVAALSAEVTESERLRQQLAAAQSDGEMVKVPRKPTEGMLLAARDWSYEKYGKPIGDDAAKGCYYAMLAASKKEGT